MALKVIGSFIARSRGKKFLRWLCHRQFRLIRERKESYLEWIVLSCLGFSRTIKQNHVPIRIISHQRRGKEITTFEDTIVKLTLFTA